MILAAGRGKRLQPLTDHCPKPLVQVGGKPLIEYHIENLKKAGIDEIVINVSYLAEQIIEALGQGEKWDVKISYSLESPVLEVGGGIFKALPLLGEDPFIVVNGDIWTDYAFNQLSFSHSLAHLVMVNNPPQHSEGDFAFIEDNKLVRDKTKHTYTYSGIAVISPQLFSGCTLSHFPLAPLLDRAIAQGQLTGEFYAGTWMDIGSYDRWQFLDTLLTKSA
jgi:N-acetyl-alpha-D-muramate 1-phosphate uridylyltransferase